MPTKGKGSPDSLPSIAGTTSVTSSEGESDDHMSPRVLFKNSDNGMTKEVVENIQTVIESKNSMIEKKTTGATAISISSSASTEIASWNLTQDPSKKHSKSSTKRTISNSGVSTVNSSDDDDEDDDEADDSIGAFPTSEMRKLNKKTFLPNPNAPNASNLIGIPSIAAMKRPSIIFEDPEKNTVSCNRAAMSMTPKQLTDIFNSFDANKTIKSMREQLSSLETNNDANKDEPSGSPTSAAETVRSTAARWMDGWIPQNESLERELQALKLVLDDNSDKMLNLREAVETQRALNALKEVEIEDKEKELQEMRTELKDLIHQKELFVQREQELLETIEELTDKIDDLIDKNSQFEKQSESGQRAIGTSAELEPFDEPRAKKTFDVEPEPFDEAEDRESCIRQQESLIAGLRSTLKSKDKDIFLLKERIDKILAKIGILELCTKDSAAALNAKDAEILSLKARLEVALTEVSKNEVDTDESQDIDIDSTETVEGSVDSPSFEETDELRDATLNNESSSKEEPREEPMSEHSSKNEEQLSDIEQENAPPSPSLSSPPPPPAPTGLVAELRKKLETQGIGPAKPENSEGFRGGRVVELRKPLEEKGSISPSRGRSPTPVLDSSTEGNEQEPTPNPVPPTPRTSPVTSQELRSAIASLSKQIDVMESVGLESSSSDVSCKASCEISTIVVNPQENDDPRWIDYEEDECPGTIEVMLEGQHYGNLDARRQNTDRKGLHDEDESCCCWSTAVTADLDDF